ncbi:hypothetical protein B0H11DRAFT_2247351 [Mycena galericulata]|nr:hypothetical protein B0H11DRAFT_2247351 [Mycena galericulata]
MPRSKLDLPVELEREIFEMAAKADVGTALRLALVARRVQSWIEPIIYSRVVVAEAPEVAVLPREVRALRAYRSLHKSKSKRAAPQVNVPRFIRTLPFRPASFFAHHVKRLHLGNLSEPHLLTVLAACTGATELGWWGNDLTAPVATALVRLPLTRLAVDRTFHFHFFLPGTSTSTSIGPAFDHLTHLDLTFDTMAMPALPPLDPFPALTHLSLAFSSLFVPASLPTFVAPVFEPRPGAPRMRILLLLSETLYYDHLTGVRPRHPDPRVVVMLPPVGSWTSSRVHDAWPLAEDVMRERRARVVSDKAAAAPLDS